MKKLIPFNRSVVVALDVEDATACGEVAEAVKDVPGIGGFKIGMTAGLKGLGQAVGYTRMMFGRDTTIIFDYQKAGNDIPDMGPKFAKEVKDAGCDAAILFPFAGPETQTRWTESCQEAGIRVIVGGIMTHAKFLVSEGGYIADNAPDRIFRRACDQGVLDFVVPGTKIEWVKRLRKFLVARLGEGNFVLYAPGFVTQGGDISECGLAAGKYFHAIVGSAIYDKKTAEAMRNAALLLTSKLVA